jgi:phosphoribosylformylglycinamidine synthase
LFLVTPRIGTISPWSSKATDIAATAACTPSSASNAALPTGSIGGRRRKLSACREGSRLAALLHDRMLETVLDDFAQTAPICSATLRRNR